MLLAQGPRPVERLADATGQTIANASQHLQVDRQTLVSRLRSGQVILIDVRPHEEYIAGHLAGARSVPLDACSRGAAIARVVWKMACSNGGRRG